MKTNKHLGVLTAFAVILFATLWFALPPVVVNAQTGADPWEEVFNSSTYRYLYDIETYNGKLYAIASNGNENPGAMLYVSADGVTWTEVPGFPDVLFAHTLYVYNHRLYIGTTTDNLDGEPADRDSTIYYYDGNSFVPDFTESYSGGYPGINDFTEHNGALYAIYGHEGRVYKRNGDGNWELAGDVSNCGGRDLESFGGCLYMGTGYSPTGCHTELWRDCGSGWEKFEDYQDEMGALDAVNKLAVYNNKLYVGTNYQYSDHYVFEYTQTPTDVIRTRTWITAGVGALEPIGAELWLGAGGTYSKKGDSDWVSTKGIGTSTFALFNGYVYAGKSYYPSGNAQIFRKPYSPCYTFSGPAYLSDSSNPNSREGWADLSYDGEYFHSCWWDDRNGAPNHDNDIYCTRSLDGLTWEPNINVSDPGNVDSDWDIYNYSATDGDGHVYVTWDGGGIWVSHYYSGTWTAPSRAWTAGGHSTIAAAPGGHVYLVNAEMTHVGVSHDYGQTFSQPSLGISNAYNARVVADDSGNVFIIYTSSADGYNSTYYVRSSDRGNTWSAPNLIADVGPGARHWPYRYNAEIHNSQLYIYFADYGAADGEDLYLIRGTIEDTTVDFDAPVLVTHAHNYNEDVHFPIGVEGDTVYLGWTDLEFNGVSGNRKSFISISHDGGETFPDQIEIPMPPRAISLNNFIVQNGNIYLTAQHLDANNHGKAISFVAHPCQATSVEITAVAPDQGYNDIATMIYIHGTGFETPLTVTLGSTQLDTVYSDANLIVAWVPAGLAPGQYTLSVDTLAGRAVADDAYRVLDHAVWDDLRSESEWLWSDPLPLRVGYANSGVGLNVQHQGGKSTIDSVTVEFHLNSPQGELLGVGQTMPLPPNAISPTNKVIWEPPATGVYTVCAIIDPNNTVSETNETNNTVCRTLTVLASGPDTTPPEVDDFIIEDNAPWTADLTVTLDITATDYPIPGASGMQAVKFIEFEYILGAGSWVPIQYSDWIDYSTAHQDYPWELIPVYGMRYMQAWTVDEANNISLRSGVDVINLLPSVQEGVVAQHGVAFYRVYLTQGETFSAQLTPVNGDPDLYVWGPNGQLWYSNKSTGADTVSFNAPVAGTYQIEVHGYTSAHYRLEFGVTMTQNRGVQITSEKPRPTEPAVPLQSQPQYYYPDVPISNSAQYRIYLPLIIR